MITTNRCLAGQPTILPSGTLLAWFLGLALVLGWVMLGHLPAAVSQPATGPATAYVGARVYTAAEPGLLENATIVVVDGRIQAIGGPDVTIPEAARVVDWSGKTVLPGIVDPYYANSGLRPSGGGGAGTEGGPRGFGGAGGGGPSPEAPDFLRILDLWNPGSTEARVPLRTGITTMHVVTSGYGFSLFTQPQQDGQQWRRDWSGRLFVAVSPNTTSLEILRRGLTQQPAAARRPPAAAPAAGRGRRPPREEDALPLLLADETEKAAADRNAASPDESLANDKLWEQVRQGQKPLLVNANNAAAILHVLKIVREVDKARVILVANPNDLYLVRQEIKDSGVHVIVRPRLETLPNSAARVNLVRELHQLGVPWSFSLSSNQADFVQSQDVPLFPVATLVRTGLDPEAAVRGLTIHPARALGLESQVGSLEVGKQADLLVFDSDPWYELGALQQVIVDGGLVYEDR